MAPPKKRDPSNATEVLQEAVEKGTIGPQYLEPQLPPIVTSLRTPDGLVLIRRTSLDRYCAITFEPGPPPDVAAATAPAAPVTAPEPQVATLWQERLRVMAKDMGLSETEYLEQLLRRAWVSRPIDKKAG